MYVKCRGGVVLGESKGGCEARIETRTGQRRGISGERKRRRGEEQGE
jgi:hypothetical protein